MTKSPTGQVECYMCGELYTPDAARVSAWAASGQDWEPTDWECGTCDYDSQPDYGIHPALGADYENEDWEDDDMSNEDHATARRDMERSLYEEADNEDIESAGWWHSDLSAGLDGGIEGDSD